MHLVLCGLCRVLDRRRGKIPLGGRGSPIEQVTPVTLRDGRQTRIVDGALVSSWVLDRPRRRGFQLYVRVDGYAEVALGLPRPFGRRSVQRSAPSVDWGS